jgi:hypothetical protein
MTQAQISHEEGIVRAFIQKTKHGRCLAFLSTPRNRNKFTKELCHFGWLDERFAHPIPPRTAHTVKEIAALLRDKGAPSTVWVVSEDSALDGREQELEVAIQYVWGRGIGSILSCIPGKLAYFEDEEKRRLLQR